MSRCRIELEKLIELINNPEFSGKYTYYHPNFWGLPFAEIVENQACRLKAEKIVSESGSTLTITKKYHSNLGFVDLYGKASGIHELTVSVE
ncbi:Hypothetical protein HVR_LOCUS237 [uncultured virus]|nr:Hypothetical protein HVR_LOCUS237 [uncultured virus]